MEIIKGNYTKRCTETSDINEHISTLSHYASKCNTVTECGMRSCNSTWGFIHGLLLSKGENKRLVSVDLNYSPNVELVKEAAKKVEINFIFMMANDLKIVIEPTDILFIDSFHVYAQLKEELRLHADKTKKYIILHDTEVDGELGEAIRNGWDSKVIAEETGFPIEGINKGLWPAVVEFLETHPQWKLLIRFTNNNGLTVLERIH